MNGLLAFLVVLALCVATYFLGRSLFTHLRRVPASFDSPAEGTVETGRVNAAPPQFGPQGGGRERDGSG